MFSPFNKMKGNHLADPNIPPEVVDDLGLCEPWAVLLSRGIWRGYDWVSQRLIACSGLPEEEATWVNDDHFRAQFLDFSLEDKAVLERGGGFVTPLAYQRPYYGIEKSFRKLAPLVVQWVTNFHNTQILIMVFLAVISLLLAGFFIYHVKLCLTNTTTNESFKWHEHLKWQRKVNEAEASAAALKVSLGELNQERKPRESKWKTFFGRSRLEELQVVKNNIYDRGSLHNIYEVLVPLSTRRSFLLNKSKSG
ncbi:hypothetical protein OROGR_029771 [Orobanche gracilis]